MNLTGVAYKSFCDNVPVQLAAVYNAACVSSTTRSLQWWEWDFWLV